MWADAAGDVSIDASTLVADIKLSYNGGDEGGYYGTTNPTIDTDSTGSSGSASIEWCLSGTYEDFAVQIEDTEGNVSNVVCLGGLDDGDVDGDAGTE